MRRSEAGNHWGDSTMTTTLKAVIITTAAIHRERIWDLQRDINRLGKIVDDNTNVIYQIDSHLLMAAIELGKLIHAYQSDATDMQERLKS